jgi:hypothetical protein
MLQIVYQFLIVVTALYIPVLVASFLTTLSDEGWNYDFWISPTVVYALVAVIGSLVALLVSYLIEFVVFVMDRLGMSLEVFLGGIIFLFLLSVLFSTSISITVEE